LTDGSVLTYYKNGTLNCTYSADSQFCTQIADPFIGDISVTCDGYRRADSGYSEDYDRLG